MEKELFDNAVGKIVKKIHKPFLNILAIEFTDGTSLCFETERACNDIYTF